MKDIFIKRYEDAVMNYFNYNADLNGKMCGHAIVHEYERILMEVFDIPEEEVSEMYQKLYHKQYFQKNWINNEIKKEYQKTCLKKDWIRNEIGYIPVESEEGINFYYKAMHDYDMGLTDADDYAWLNTLFQYDIGADNALQIINWYYEEQNTTVQEAVSVEGKETLRNICELELGLHLNFDNFVTEEPKAFKIY